MIVFRFEDKDRVGPYYEDEVLDRLGHTSENGHPPPEYEGDYTEDWDEHIKSRRFAFESLKKAYAWFSKEEVELLCLNGYFMTAYEVPEVHTAKLEKQMVFEAKKAKRVA